MFGLLLAVGFAWWAVQMVAAESGEVVIVTTIDSEGRPHETRLWIVDHERGEQVGRYLAQPQPWQRETINSLMAEKYDWAEWYIGLVFNRERSIPIRLEVQED